MEASERDSIADAARSMITAIREICGPGMIGRSLFDSESINEMFDNRLAGNPAVRAVRAVLAIALALCLPLAPLQAETAIALSDNPDAVARFVRAPGAPRPGGEVELMLVIRTALKVQQISVSAELLVRFARADADQIRWCAYLATVEQIVRGGKGCDPTNSLKDKGEYRVP